MSDDKKALLGFGIGVILIVLVEVNEMYLTHKGGIKK